MVFKLRVCALRERLPRVVLTRDAYFERSRRKWLRSRRRADKCRAPTLLRWQLICCTHSWAADKHVIQISGLLYRDTGQFRAYAVISAAEESLAAPRCLGYSRQAEHGDFLACLFCRRGVVCHFFASRRRERGWRQESWNVRTVRAGCCCCFSLRATFPRRLACPASRRFVNSCASRRSNLLLHHLVVKRSESEPRQRFSEIRLVAIFFFFLVTFSVKDECHPQVWEISFCAYTNNTCMD